MIYTEGTKVITKCVIITKARSVDEIRYDKGLKCTIISSVCSVKGLDDKEIVYTVRLPDGSTAKAPAISLRLASEEEVKPAPKFKSGDEVHLNVDLEIKPTNCANQMHLKKGTPLKVLSYCETYYVGEGAYFVENVDGVSFYIRESMMETYVSPSESELLLFVEKCSGYQFHGRVICESDKFMIVDKCGGQNEEVAVKKSLYKIFKEVK